MSSTASYSLPFSPDNPRKLALREGVDTTLEEIERWRRFNASYHDDDRKFMRLLVPPGKRVLDLGCGARITRSWRANANILATSIRSAIST
jgi:cyclopropane fatty-acyl-phospholipid synthase-like methyltransferase